MTARAMVLNGSLYFGAPNKTNTIPATITDVRMKI
ncbi:MAG: hypothetical protein HW412_1649, partial [Bacteroidetes bacterium]|nr:hypothetical protein [Bacteroidota bacterium]